MFISIAFIIRCIIAVVLLCHCVTFYSNFIPPVSLCTTFGNNLLATNFGVVHKCVLHFTFCESKKKYFSARQKIMFEVLSMVIERFPLLHLPFPHVFLFCFPLLQFRIFHYYMLFYSKLVKMKNGNEK